MPFALFAISLVFTALIPCYALCRSLGQWKEVEESYILFKHIGAWGQKSSTSINLKEMSQLLGTKLPRRPSFFINYQINSILSLIFKAIKRKKKKKKNAE